LFVFNRFIFLFVFVLFLFSPQHQNEVFRKGTYRL